MIAEIYTLDAAARDFDRVSAALAFLGDHWQDHPDLDAAASAAGLSPHHFQRVFTRWVGVSPKKYVGALAHGAARAALDEGACVLDASFEAGLSGPGRLHDLFIAHEAVTPGEARRRGAGLDFVWGAAPTPFGEAVFLVAPRGLSALAFADPDPDGGFADLEARYPAANYRRDDGVAREWAERVFAATPGEPIPLALYGTPWQRQVWRALLSIPAGATTTYKSIADAVGSAKASRAVGAAVGANPVSWLIPCHRVLASNGLLTGYHWGVDRKRAMLAYEAARGVKGGMEWTLYIVALIIFTICASLLSRWLAARINLTADARIEYAERLETKPGTIKGVDEAVFVKLYVGAHEPRWALYIPTALMAATLSTPLVAIALTAFWPVFTSVLDGGPWYDVGYYPWMFYMFFGFCGLWALCAAVVARIHHARAPEAFQPALARARGEPLDDVVIKRGRPKWAVKARPDPTPESNPAAKSD